MKSERPGTAVTRVVEEKLGAVGCEPPLFGNDDPHGSTPVAKAATLSFHQFP
jgi:hypothetical protein